MKSSTSRLLKAALITAAIGAAQTAAAFMIPAIHWIPTGAAAITNGSFESGFSGWVTHDLSSPFAPLSIATAGSGNSFGWSWSSTPTDGVQTAFSGFDGNGPGQISVAQDIGVLGNGQQLSFDYRAAWDLVSFGATQARSFDVFIEEAGGGNLLGSFQVFSAAAGTRVDDTGALTGLVDLGGFVGQNVRIAFVLDVPENFSGPAQFQLDNVRLSAVPEPWSLALVGLGLAGVAVSRRTRHSRRAA